MTVLGQDRDASSTPPAWLTIPENILLPEVISLNLSQMQSALLELWELGIELQESGAAIGSDIVRIIQEKGNEHELEDRS